MPDAPKSELARLYEMATGGSPDALHAALSPDTPKMGWISRFLLRRESEAMTKAVAKEIVNRALEPKEQGSVVNMTFDVMRMYDTSTGVREKTALTYDLLRAFAHSCEPANAIIEKRIAQVAAFCQLPEQRGGYVRKPGFRVKMTNPEEEAGPDDQKRMRELEHFLLHGGYTDPPESERPAEWQPGFENFVRQLVRDTLTLDWVAVRRWKSATDPDEYPLVSFACVDAARIRKVRKPVKEVKQGVAEPQKWPGERTTADDEIATVKMSNTQTGGVIEEEYTAFEIATGVRNPRTDETANGYGYGELERCINAISIWIYARDYNASRFRMDALPRGILSILNQVNETQFQMFKLEWAQMLKGLGKRWNIPILRGLPQAGAAINWIPMDMSSRDQEYHQFMFSVALWLHAAYQIHPEETGYEALSPFRPPLSEASPETKLEYSQDTGLNPLMTWVANFINRNILWVVQPDRRYMMEWLGTGQYDEMQQVELWAAELEAGLNTPGNIWALRDLPRPPSIADHPAWDLPMPLAMGMQYVDSLQQAAQAEQMQQAQMQQAQEAHDMSMDQGRLAMMQGGAPPGAGAGPGQGGGIPTTGSRQDQPLRPLRPMAVNSPVVGSGGAQAFAKALSAPLYTGVISNKHWQTKRGVKRRHAVSGRGRDTGDA